MSATAEIGLIGLAVMGRNLALNIADHGFRTAVHNRTPEVTRDFAASQEATGRPIVPALQLGDLVATLERPRVVVLMVKAGAPTDDQIEALAPLLEPADLIVDGGNAHYLDTIRRGRALAERGLLFSGTGISGGEEGARHGPAIMAGGPDEAYARIGKVLEEVAAKVEGEPCCAHLGPDGAGHFVKMMHNGIEYADMQLIAEAYGLMRDLLRLEPIEMAAAFRRWNEGPLASYLFEITADILEKEDPLTGRSMVEVILDAAGQKGTGGWAVTAALELGVPAPTIAEAVFARALSARKAERMEAEALYGASEASYAGASEPVLRALHDALLAARIAVHAQGFAVMAAASHAHGWSLRLDEVARIWRGGCILRARLLEPIRQAWRDDPIQANLLLDRGLLARLVPAEAGLRTVVAQAAEAGVAVPAFGSALAYLQGYRRGRGVADLIQAQRDYFGAHGYERNDRPGRFHSEWSAL